jgi:hypothetical protein
MDINRLIIQNFEVICAFCRYEGRTDLQEAHEIALKKLRAHSEPLTPAHPVLTTTIFDGINTRNKVLKIIQSGSDLEEVRVFKKHVLFHQIMQDYEHAIKN